MSEKQHGGFNEGFRVLEDFVCQAIPDLNRTVVQPPKKRAVEADRRDETGNKTEIPEDGGESKPPLGNS